MPETNLPLTGPADTDRPFDHEREIAHLVERFYTVARRDPLLGPVFERHVTDWDWHLRTMNDFWSAAIYRTGRYSGRPLEVHRMIAGMSAEHFSRWLFLWKQTVDEVVRSDAREPLKSFAGRMAETMSCRMGLGSPLGIDA